MLNPALIPSEAERSRATGDVSPGVHPVPLRVGTVRDRLAFASLRAEWTELLAASDAGMFNAWEWLYPWHQRIGSDRELRILTARDAQGVLVGLFPLCLERRKLAPGLIVRRLSFLGETHVGSDYLEVVARRGFGAEVTRAFASTLREARADWDVLDLTDLDEASSTPERLKEGFQGPEWTVDFKERYICPYETFEAGETFEAFLKRTGRRDNYLRRRKWLEKQPGFAIERTETPAGLVEPVSDFFRLHALRWSSDGGSQGIRNAKTEAFHRDATYALAQGGHLWLYTLKLGHRALASVYGIVRGGKFAYFQSGYDPEWRNKSVGLVLIGQTFKDAIEAGLSEYDFLHGTETYKSDWTSQRRNTVSVRVYCSEGNGAWLMRSELTARRFRSLVKRLLPTAGVEALRGFRHRADRR